MAEATHRLAALPAERGEGELFGSHDGRQLRIAVICGRFNAHVTSRLLEGALRKLDECGVTEENRVVVWVPGSFELPLAAQLVVKSGGFDAVVCLGAVIRGDTAHFEFVAGECAAGLQRVQLDTGLPVAFGVLTTENLFQAFERSGGSRGDKGAESVETAIEMVNVLRDVTERGASLRSRARTPLSY